jgi:hypothetical protein
MPVVVAAALAFTAAATAQVGTVYTFAQSVGTYTPITGGTQLAVCTGSSGAAALDDVVYPTVALPFPFIFEGAPYSAVNVSSNGFLTFGATLPTTTTYGALSSATAYSGAVAAFSRDIQSGFCFTADRTLGSNTLTNVSALGPAQVGDFITGTGIPAATTITAIAGNVITMSANATSTGTLGQTQVFGPWSEIRYETLGAAPNRVFVVQWTNFKRFSTGTISQHMYLNFQIRLNESSHVIDVVYGDCSPGVSTTTTVIQVGLRGPNNTFPANVNNRLNVKGASDWATSTAGTANTSGQVFNNVAPANVIPNGLTYTWAPAGTFAINATLGQGCITSFTSFYELFGAPANFDLAGQAITMTPAGGGYVVTPGGAFLPVGSVQAVPTALALGDDAGVAQPFTVGTFAGPGGPWTGVYVISNGCVSDIAGNTTTAAPVATTMLAAPRPGFYTQADFDPVGGTGAGTIWFEESASVVTVTWDNVASWNHPGSQNTFQVQLYPSGAVTMAWTSLAAVGSNGGVLVGYSPGGPSANPGSTDLSATLFPAGNILLTATDTLPVVLAGTSRPVTGTNWGFNVTGIPAAGIGGIEIFGLADPGVLDLGFLGAPGCGVRASLDALNVWIGAGPSHAYSLAIPAGPALIGAEVFSTAAVLVPGVNALLGGTLTTNGIKGTIGDV